ncbi:type I-E CRISPR-associated protein Cas6/Cse3/CasE [Methylovulum miyakonense]|uniref:type I-E CRISPR-associated protein Cas6/Cse3/CasE n=1 Tax=Methylovulum miyakonense TaxID=645578 RepID=UPI00036E635C|nr:type I-E CRISPR-associated protein Cas6/Cse3/CasE [Methylovulum miyakonense]
MYFSRVKIQPDILKSSQLSRVLEGNVYGSHRLLWDLFPEQDQRTFLYREEIAREQLSASPAVRGESIYYLVSQIKPIETPLFKVESKGYRPQLEQGQRLGFDCRVNPVITRQGKKHDVVMDAQLQFLSSLVKGFQLDSLLSAKPEKGEYKKLLLANGAEALSLRLTELLANDLRYTERLEQIAHLADKLEWAIKAQVDTALENWFKKQGERLGFELLVDDDGLSKLQNSGYLWHGLPAKAKHKGDKSGFSAVDFCGELKITDVQKFEQALFQGIGRAKAFGCGLLMIRRV